MKQFLPARPLLPTVLLLLLALLVRPALASHLLGGELTYRYIDNGGPAAAPLRYEITVTVYNNCSTVAPIPIAPNTIATVGIFNQVTGARLTLTTVNYAGASGGVLIIPQTSLSNCITPAIPAGCTITGPSQPFKVQKFIALVNLPTQPAGQGYNVVWSDGSRNAGITNLAGSNGLNFELYTTMTPPAIFNRSPVFANQAVAIICANDTSYYLNNAIDADGDRLEYSFGQPFSGSLPTTFTTPPPGVPYAPGYSATAPFGTGRGVVSHLDTSTGIATYGTPTNGQYSVAVDVREYRFINGVEQLIGTTRRDVQLIVATCPPVPAPVLPPPAGSAGGLARDYTIEAGTTQTIPITVAQSSNHPLTLTASSELLDGVGGFNATLNGNPGTASGLVGAATATGNGSVVGTFAYSASCTEARATPYVIAVEVRDDGCAGRTIYDSFRITVVNPTGPKTITGDAAVCAGSAPSSYTAGGGGSGSAPGVTWNVTGGTIVGSATANPVQVQWTTGGTLTVRGVSVNGCFSDAITKNVTIGTAPTLAVAGNLAICQGSSTTITPSGAVVGATYTVTGGPVTGSGTTFVLTPTATTTYTVTSSATATSCAGTAQVTVTVNPAPTLAVASNLAICQGSSTTITPSGAGAGATYTVTGGPVTGSGTTFVLTPTATTTYTVTSTALAGGCPGTAQVTVTVNPAPTLAVAGNLTICQGSSTTITPSGAGVGATYTVTGGPVTGSGTTFVLTPTATTTYTVTSTALAGGCPGTAQVTVTVNPAPTLAVAGNLAICQGSSTTITPSGAGAGATYTVTGGPVTGSGTTFVLTPTATTTYTVTSSATATSCAGTAQVTVTVNPAPTLAVAGSLAICQGSSTTITPSGAGVGATYTVTGGPVTGSGTTFVLTPTATTTYTVTSSATATSCAGTAQVTVTVNPAPTLAVAGNRTICPGSSTTITVSGAGVGATYTVTGGPVTGSGTTFVLTPTATTTYIVTSSATATNCAGTAQVSITVNPAVVAVAGAAVATTTSQPVTIGAAPVAGNTYSWSPATGLSSPTVANPTVTLTNTSGVPITQTYTLTTTNTVTGCSGTASVVVTVNVDPTLVFYNIITPNGDGLNDKLQIKNAGAYPGSTVEIYNRWGRQVFATNSYDNNTNYWGADPTITSGTYYYIFKQANGTTTKGWVQVVK